MKRQHLDILNEEARRVHPVEACAMLFGKTRQKEAGVKRLVVAPNMLQSASRFEIAPEKFAEAFLEAKKKGLEFLGLFHSHPTRATPSAIDVKQMKLWDDAIWLILSSIDGRLAAYQMENDRVREIAIKVK